MNRTEISRIRYEKITIFTRLCTSNRIENSLTHYESNRDFTWSHYEYKIVFMDQLWRERYFTCQLPIIKLILLGNTVNRGETSWHLWEQSKDFLELNWIEHKFYGTTVIKQRLYGTTVNGTKASWNREYNEDFMKPLWIE